MNEESGATSARPRVLEAWTRDSLSGRVAAWSCDGGRAISGSYHRWNECQVIMRSLRRPVNELIPPNFAARPRELSQLSDDAIAERAGGGFGAGSDAKFGEDVADVDLDSAAADEERVGDLRV